MKTKIRKVRSSSDLGEKLEGVGDFQCTGPCPSCGTRVTLEFTKCVRFEAADQFTPELRKKFCPECVKEV